MVKSKLMRRSAPQPRSRKTPRGGSTTAQMILMMSLGWGLACGSVVVRLRPPSRVATGVKH
jgi:hypothetical protein